MSYVEKRGNLFASTAQTLVNTVNCVGVMGKGIALEFRRRYPEMFEAYRRVCEQGKLKPGDILPYQEAKPWILNVAVKSDWKHPSRLQWVEACLRSFCSMHQELGITSVAFPWIGAENGGLPWEQVQALMRDYLEPIADLDIEVIEFDPTAPDPLFAQLRGVARRSDLEGFMRWSGLTRRAADTALLSLSNPAVTSLACLASQPGLGETSLNRLYQALTTPSQSQRQSGQIHLL